VPGLVAFLRPDHKAQVLAMALDLHILPIGNCVGQALSEGVKVAFVQWNDNAFFEV